LTASGNQNGSPQQSKLLPKIEKQEDGRTENDVAQFTAALGQACIALRQYGKSPSELKAMRDMFLTALSDIPVTSLTKALFIHLNKSDEIPTPRQLRDIVYPSKPVWKPDWAVYISLKKRIHEGYFPLSDERLFLRDCESYAINKRGDDMTEYDKAKLEVTQHLRLVQSETYD
jgi:hypothetical protein